MDFVWKSVDRVNEKHYTKHVESEEATFFEHEVEQSIDDGGCHVYYGFTDLGRCDEGR